MKSYNSWNLTVKEFASDKYILHEKLVGIRIRCWASYCEDTFNKLEWYELFLVLNENRSDLVADQFIYRIFFDRIVEFSVTFWLKVLRKLQNHSSLYSYWIW